MQREDAKRWLLEHVKSESLIKHCLAVEGAMMGYAKAFNEPVERYRLCGLLHDIDFEMYPEEHPLVGVKWLEEKGFDEEFCLAVKGHGDHTQTPRETLLAKTLYAVDEMASFIIAVALVRPEKLQGISVKSVQKKLKDKAFARAVSREGIVSSAEALGVNLPEHIQRVIDALTAYEIDLNEQGESLL